MLFSILLCRPAIREFLVFISVFTYRHIINIIFSNQLHYCEMSVGVRVHVSTMN
jgi:hypothetical protein